MKNKAEKQRNGETDQHFYDRCRYADREEEIYANKCKCCGGIYETDGSCNGLCFNCDKDREE